jgi:hypothetical protein
MDMRAFAQSVAVGDSDGLEESGALGVGAAAAAVAVLYTKSRSHRRTNPDVPPP